jgi:hypothetical protein
VASWSSNPYILATVLDILHTRYLSRRTSGAQLVTVTISRGLPRPFQLFRLRACTLSLHHRLGPVEWPRTRYCHACLSFKEPLRSGSLVRFTRPWSSLPRLSTSLPRVLQGGRNQPRRCCGSLITDNSTAAWSCSAQKSDTSLAAVACLKGRQFTRLLVPAQPATCLTSYIVVRPVSAAAVADSYISTKHYSVLTAAGTIMSAQIRADCDEVCPRLAATKCAHIPRKLRLLKQDDHGGTIGCDKVLSIRPRSVSQTSRRIREWLSQPHMCVAWRHTEKTQHQELVHGNRAQNVHAGCLAFCQIFRSCDTAWIASRTLLAWCMERRFIENV